MIIILILQYSWDTCPVYSNIHISFSNDFFEKFLRKFIHALETYEVIIKEKDAKEFKYNKETYLGISISR